ncbi:MAG: type II toxin-antitoxin system RelE/ParE family toxin [Betaproteobacteria bacterium]|nr:type II toxin-antitoxin system RelE/ParE family toxin [Betaproteobacteria bacterium]
MPDDVIDVFGFALHLAQTGKKHNQAKPLKGFGGAGVLEVIEDHLGDTYRAVYTVKIVDAVFVLHCFQKKSKQGIETPKHDLDIIRERLKAA